MNLSQSVGLSQHHGLHITTELKQGISVLQMTAADLSDYVKSCMEENPFFDDGEWMDRRHPLEEGAFKREMSADELLERRGHGSPERFDAERPSMAQRSFSFDRYLEANDSLESHLIEQLGVSVGDPRDYAIGEYLIGNIDDSGYLQTPLSFVADELGVDEKDVERVLRIIWKFDPVGVGARNLSECLMLQLEERQDLSPLVERLVKDHLADFESHTPTSIAHSMGVPLHELVAALDVVRTCNPRPAGQFGRSSRPVWPEVVVEATGEGIYRVHLQDFYLPHLRINEQYRLLASSVTEQGVQTYLKDKLKEAETLMASIDYRKATLYKVACCIAEMQVDFFERGYDFIRPLTMAQVAQATDVSESTVSRLANGNYMSTPRGVFELRFFFHSGMRGAAEGGVSSLSIKRKISDLVAHENPGAPLSDQAIADALASQDITISRRTVNKYREELNIPAKSARRRR